MVRDFVVASAAGGTALTTTAVDIVFPSGAQTFEVRPIFSGAATVIVRPIPYAYVVKTTDLLATRANLTDYTAAAQDGNTATDVVLSSLDTVANLHALYVGTWVPFAGMQIDVDAANANASVIAVTYWNGTTWANITPTDNTISTGATFGQDGSVTWTVPTDWVQRALAPLIAGGAFGFVGDTSLYWVRVAVSAALDSSTTLNSLLAIPRTTSGIELPNVAGVTYRETGYKGPGGLAGVRALTNTSNASLMVNVGSNTSVLGV